MAMNDKTFSEALTFTRASTKWVWDDTGTLVEVPVDQPAYDHDPVTGEPLGILIEPGATNSHPFSNNVSLWSYNYDTQFTVTNLGAVDSPVIGHDIWRVVRTTTYTSRTYFGDTSALPDIAVNHTATIFAIVRPAGHNFFYMSSGNRSGYFSGARFDLTATRETHVPYHQYTGSYNGSPAVYFHDSGIVELSDGWRLCWATLTRADGYNTKVMDFHHTDVAMAVSQSRDFVGDGVNGIEFVHAQAEPGTVFTSVIPTAGAAVTRAADSVSRNVDSLFGAGGVTAVIDYAAATIPASFSPFKLFDSVDPPNRLIINYSSASNDRAYSGSTSLALDVRSAGRHRVATALGPDTFQAASNGVASAVAEPGSDPGAFDTLELSEGNTVTHLRHFSIYPYAMSQAELEARTAP